MFRGYLWRGGGGVQAFRGRFECQKRLRLCWEVDKYAPAARAELSKVTSEYPSSRVVHRFPCGTAGTLLINIRRHHSRTENEKCRPSMHDGSNSLTVCGTITCSRWQIHLFGGPSNVGEVIGSYKMVGEVTWSCNLVVCFVY